MVAATQSPFSQEEESIIQDFKDLCKKNSQDDFELSCYIHKYMELLGRMDLDEALTHITISFVKAAVIIEHCCKVYCGKVDRLAFILELLLESFISKNGSKKRSLGLDGELGDDEGGDGEVDREAVAAAAAAATAQPRRRRRLKDSVAEEDFFEIDNKSGLSGKSANEPEAGSDFKLRFLERDLNLFTKTKKERKRVNVCLKKVEDKDESRLRDWVLNTDMMVVRELFSSLGMSDESRFVDEDQEDMDKGADLADGNDDWLAGPSTPAPLTPAPTDHIEDGFCSNSEASYKVGYQNTDDLLLDRCPSVPGGGEGMESSVLGSGVLIKYVHLLGPAHHSSLSRDKRCDALIDMALIISNDKIIEDVIVSKKPKPGVTTKPACELCNSKKIHKKGGKRCIANSYLGTLDNYFHPHVQPLLSEPPHGVLPDEELFSLYKKQIKAVNHLRRRAARGSPEPVDHVRDAPFAGFDEEDDEIIQRGGDCSMSEMLGDDGGMDNGFELPLPVVDNMTSSIPGVPMVNDGSPNKYLLSPDDVMSVGSPDRGYPNLAQELKEIGSAQQCFERNKLLAMRIAEWHGSLTDKIALSEQRGSLNMDALAATIMSDLPAGAPLPFRDLVRSQRRRDVPRYFLACLQLTNEGNINIEKSSSESKAMDCMSLTRLRATRVKELDEYNPDVTDTGLPSTSGGKRRHEEIDGEERNKCRKAPKPKEAKKRARTSPLKVSNKKIPLHV